VLVAAIQIREGVCHDRPAALRLPDQRRGRGPRRPLEPDRAARSHVRRPSALPPAPDRVRGGHRLQHPGRSSAIPGRGGSAHATRPSADSGRPTASPSRRSNWCRSWPSSRPGACGTAPPPTNCTCEPRSWRPVARNCGRTAWTSCANDTSAYRAPTPVGPRPPTSQCRPRGRGNRTTTIRLKPPTQDDRIHEAPCAVSLTWEVTAPLGEAAV
jgi:hypothetical protein